MWMTILVTLIIVSIAMAGMAVGYLLSGKCFSASCAEPTVSDGEGATCGTCGRTKREANDEAETAAHSS
jgi:hypothetical protein